MRRKTEKRDEGQGIISAQLRAILQRSNETTYALERDAEIPHGGLARFASGSGSLTLSSVDRLAKVLNLRLVETEKRVGNRKARSAKSNPVAETVKQPQGEDDRGA
jgi:DNA-binding phage protein